MTNLASFSEITGWSLKVVVSDQNAGSTSASPGVSIYVCQGRLSDWLILFLKSVIQ